jgi:hypothetical protein
MPEQQPQKRPDFPKKVRFWLIMFAVFVVTQEPEYLWFKSTTFPISSAWQLMSPRLCEICLPAKIGKGRPMISVGQRDYPMLTHGGVSSEIMSAGMIRIFPKLQVYANCNYGVIKVSGRVPSLHYAWAPIIVAPYSDGWQVAYPFYMHPRIIMPKQMNYTVTVLPNRNMKHMFTRILLKEKKLRAKVRRLRTVQTPSEK